MFVAIAAKVGTLDEADGAIVANLHVEPAVLDRDDRDSGDSVLGEAGRSAAAGGNRSATLFDLLDAKRDAFLFDVHVKHDRLDGVALVVQRQSFFARHAPGDVRHVDHAIDVAVETNEQTEFGRVLDFAFDGRANRVNSAERFPRVRRSLLEAQRNAALFFVDFEHDDIDFLAGRNDLAGVDVLLGPAHFRNVDKAFDTGFEFNERTIFGDVRDAARKLGADRILGRNSFPRIAFQLLHAERDALRVLVDADDLHLHGVTNVDDFRRMIDALVADVGDMQQAVNAAEINERTVIGDVLDDAFNDLAFSKVQDQARACFCAAFFKDGATRHNDVATLAVHLEDLEGLRNVHERGDIAHGADIDLRAGKEGHSAAEVDGEAALNAAKDDAFNAGGLAEFSFKSIPGGFAACAVARQHGFTLGVFDAVDINFDFIANSEFSLLAGGCEFAKRDAAFRLQANVDDGHVVFNCGHDTLDDAAVEAFGIAE